jgi:hypothetical protein
MEQAELLSSNFLARQKRDARDQITSCKVNNSEARQCYSSADTVVDYAVEWAIVQTQEWNTLYILSRERQPAAATLDVSMIHSAVPAARLTR